MDDHSIPTTNSRAGPPLDAPAAVEGQTGTISLTPEELNHQNDSHQNNFTSEERTFHQSEPIEQTPVNDVDMSTRPSEKRSTRLSGMELPVWRKRTEDDDIQSHVHPFKKLAKFLWELLVLPFRLIISVVKFLVILLCIIISIVWIIPCTILSVGWATTVFISAGNRCTDDDDDDDDDFDNFLCWGVFPCCGIGFFPALAIYGCQGILGLGTVLVNPDNTSGLNNWLATSIRKFLEHY